MHNGTDSGDVAASPARVWGALWPGGSEGAPGVRSGLSPVPWGHRGLCVQARRREWPGQGVAGAAATGESSPPGCRQLLEAPLHGLHHMFQVRSSGEMSRGQRPQQIAPGWCLTPCQGSGTCLGHLDKTFSHLYKKIKIKKFYWLFIL